MNTANSYLDRSILVTSVVCALLSAGFAQRNDDCQPNAEAGAYYSDLNADEYFAESFSFCASTTLTSIEWWGAMPDMMPVYASGWSWVSGTPSSDFQIQIFDGDIDGPGMLIYDLPAGAAITRSPTGKVVPHPPGPWPSRSFPEQRYEVQLPQSIDLEGDAIYWVSIAGSTSNSIPWLWSFAPVNNGSVFSSSPTWITASDDFAFCAISEPCQSGQLPVINVQAMVDSNGTQSLQSIGVVLVNTSNDTINAHFQFDPAWAGLDDYYDFRWVNTLKRSRIACKESESNRRVGLLPAIDPKPSALSPIRYASSLLNRLLGGSQLFPKDDPYYNSPVEWMQGFVLKPSGMKTIIRVDRSFSLFADRPSMHPAGTELEFECYLVVDDLRSDSAEFFGLIGFSWSYSEMAFGQPGTSKVCCEIQSGTQAAINFALANGLQPKLTSGKRNRGYPGFPGWTSMPPTTLFLGP